RISSPSAAAKLQMTMKIFPASIDAGHKRVWSAPFIQCPGIEESQEEMTGPGHHEEFPRGTEWIIQTQRFGQSIPVVRRLAGRINIAADLARRFADMMALRIKPEILSHSPQWKIRIVIVDPFPIRRRMIKMLFARGRDHKAVKESPASCNDEHQ